MTKMEERKIQSNLDFIEYDILPALSSDDMDKYFAHDIIGAVKGYLEDILNEIMERENGIVSMRNFIESSNIPEDYKKLFNDYLDSLANNLQLVKDRVQRLQRELG